MDFIGARYGIDPVTIWRTWTLRQLHLVNQFARRGRWFDDELIIRYGGGGHAREEPDFSALTEEGVQRNRDEVELQRELQARNKERIAKIRADAQAGRRVNRGTTMGAPREYKPINVVKAPR